MMLAPSPSLHLEPWNRRAKRWLHSAPVDIGLVYGGGAAVAAFFLWAGYTNQGLVVGAALFGMFLDMPHVLTTSVRVMGDKSEFALHGRRYLLSTLLCLVAVSVAAATVGFAPAVVVWAVWQFFHVVKQHMGMTNIYLAKARYRGPRRSFKILIGAVAVAPFLVRAHSGLHFGHYEVSGRTVPFSDQSIPLPQTPLAFAVIAYGVAAVGLLLVVRDATRERSAGHTSVPLIVWFGVAFVAVSYNVAYLLVDDLLALIIIATATHSLQYHLINWRRLVGSPMPAPDGPDATDAGGGVAAGGVRRVWERVSTSPVTKPALVALAAGIAFSALETTALYAVSIALVIQHFYMDRYLWRSNQNPALSSRLGLR
jgi:hypothetical protein